jgi:nitroimidazol reductase NimA-like FMN-containing flavoprotein (pyridoxamine 5'-phosphate oxidase superfamily)
MSSEGLQRIDEDECYLLVRGRSLGRVGVKLAEDLVILPVYYGVLDRDIVFRTDPGTKLAAAVIGDRVAFEVDNAVPAWSVLMSGHAHEIRDTGEQVGARSRLGNDWPAGERDSLVRIAVDRVSGRRLPPPR